MANQNSTATRSEETSASRPRSMRTCRTFGDLMELRAPSTGYLHHCKRCRAYGAGIPHWHYSVRASICESCATKAKDELLPHVATAERKARRWVNDPDRNYDEKDVAFLASVSGATQDYVRELIRAKTAKVAP